MRLIKMLSFVAVVAATTMALAGVGTASAVTLCKENAETCPEAQRYKAGSVFAFSASKTVLKGGAFTVTCEASLEAKLDEVSGEPLKAEIAPLAYTKCEGCSKLVSTGLPATGLLYQAGPWLAHQLNAGTPGVTAECPLGVVCKYQAAENEEKPASAVLKLVGGKPATLKTGGEKSSVVKMELTGGSEVMCGKTATWEASLGQKSPETGVWTSKAP